MVRLSFFAMAMFANLAMSVASPINTETYRELTNGFGQTGACRGNGGGGDRVDSRYRILTTQTACETECDNDSGCVAYAYNTGPGDCVIYGSGQDGSCSLSVDTGELDRYHNFNSCGECYQDGAVVEDALVKSLCGICSKETPAGLTASLGVCSSVGGLWTEATWTAGTWEEPAAGWAGDSYTHLTQYGSTNVHTITIAEGYSCNDKVHEDGQATCNGSTAANSSCQTAFEDRRTSTQCPAGCTFYPRNGSHGPYCDGLASDGETSCIEGFETTDVFSEESCLAIDSQCVYVPAIAWMQPPATIHAPPADLGPGWQEVIKASVTTGDCTGRDNLPQCEGEDNIAGFMFGVCRLDTTGALNGENVNQKYCKNCINTNGDQVNLDEKACAQACLDDPSGSCMGFSHADDANCILYGVDGEHYLRHPGDLENEWLGYSVHDEPCLADKIPIGCTPNFNTIKMNTKFVCRHLNQDNTRWLAWGEATGSEEITVEITVTPSLSDPVGVEDFTQEMMNELRIKMASVAFVDADKDVSLEIGEGNQDGHVKVTFAILVPSNVIIPMTAMINTILVSKSRDGALYFHSKITTDGALQNTGELIPKAGHIAGILVKGMRHNLVDKSKELHTTSWSELSPSACSVDPVDPPCPDVICEKCNSTACPDVICEKCNSTATVDPVDTPCDICEECNSTFETNPTPDPNEVDENPGVIGGLCFSGENTVEVEGRGSISMKDLKIGDNVRSERGAFEKVYSFGHYDAKTPTDFLQIKSAGLKNPLEISANHMVFVQDGAVQKSVPAATLKVGDSLIIAANGNASKIGSIKNIQGRGAYAPFTASGKISVSGTVASNYIFMIETGPIVTMQWMAHAFNAPHRMLCSLNFGICENETYENGLSNWIAGPLHLGQWLAAQNSVVKFMGVGFLIPVFTVVSFLETVFFSTTPALVLIVAALGMMAMTSQGTKKAKNF